MKSLLISSVYFPPKTGGISEIMGAVASTLGPRRICCLTGIPANGGPLDSHFGVNVYRRPTAFGGGRLTHAVGWGLTIAEIMIRERPHMVHLATAYDGYLGLWLRQWFRLPYVVYAYGNEVLDAMRLREWKKPLVALQQADHVIAISEFTANLLHDAGVAPDRIKIVYPGCDVNYFRPLPSRMDLRQKFLVSIP